MKTQNEKLKNSDVTELRTFLRRRGMTNAQALAFASLLTNKSHRDLRDMLREHLRGLPKAP